MLTPEGHDLALWLHSLGLAMHADTFAKNDVTFDVLRSLSDADLKELGLSLGHRRILMGAVNQVRGRELNRSSGAAPGKVEQGERRQITVMFCDLVGSTEMSERLDLDDLRSLHSRLLLFLLQHHRACGGLHCTARRRRHPGVFRISDGKEDAAECAIRASLKISTRWQAGGSTAHLSSTSISGSLQECPSSATWWAAVLQSAMPLPD